MKSIEQEIKEIKREVALADAQHSRELEMEMRKLMGRPIPVNPYSDMVEEYHNERVEVQNYPTFTILNFDVPPITLNQYENRSRIDSRRKIAADC